MIKINKFNYIVMTAVAAVTRVSFWACRLGGSILCTTTARCCIAAAGWIATGINQCSSSKGKSIKSDPFAPVPPRTKLGPQGHFLKLSSSPALLAWPEWHHLRSSAKFPRSAPDPWATSTALASAVTTASSAFTASCSTIGVAFTFVQTTQQI